MSVHISYPSQRIALVTIDNEAKRNALGIPEFEGLVSAWNHIEQQPEIRCVVVTGSGETAFCSGAQLDVDFSARNDIDDLVDAALLKTRIFPKPVIAAINGHCVAGGFELMLSCDLRLASADALLGLPEVRWGIFPSGGGAMKLIEQIGFAHTMELLLTGSLISSEKALQLGLVNRVVGRADVLPQSLALADSIAQNSPLAVQLARIAAFGMRVQRWNELEPNERRSARVMRRSIDHKLGVSAFLQKQRPDYPDI
ncbi:enoyl-CoA hydratase/isomerase family protein [Variovorax sp. VNK109]|uniref:enoyl-CoA hydratase/isomerase family protein n=1 Tax=Variovorax sp. VNK109 TaxID=3400919 RepID=UPI003C00A098